MPYAPDAGIAPAPSTRAALLATAHELDDVHHSFAFTTDPVGDGWTALAGVDDERVRGWLDQLTIASGHRNVAASYLVLRLTGCVATPLMAAFLLHQRCLPIDDVGAAVHVTADQFDSLALSSGTLHALAGDPVTRQQGVSVASGEYELTNRVAARLYNVMAPIVDIVARNARYSSRTMWSSVADRLAGPAVLASNVSDTDHRRSWERTMAVVDGLADQGAPVRRRPRLLEVPWSGGTGVSSVKGTCCLKYVEQGIKPTSARDRPADFCGGCPYVADDVRIAKRQAALERTAT